MILHPEYSPLAHVLVAAIAGFAALALAVLLFYVSVKRLWGKKLITGFGAGSLALILLLAGVVAALLVSNMYVYQRLTAEQRVATVMFEQVGAQHFRAVMHEENKRSREFELLGDEWQLDARILKWTGPALLLGLDTLYRLERIQGRYREVSEERKGRRTVYSLSEENVFDLWPWLQNGNRELSWIDGLYGSSTFVPMVDGGRYGVYVTATGLIARAENEAARAVLQSW